MINLSQLLIPKNCKTGAGEGGSRWFSDKTVVSKVHQSLKEFAIIENREFAAQIPFSFAECSLDKPPTLSAYTRSSTRRRRSDSINSVSSSEENCLILAKTQKGVEIDQRKPSESLSFA